MEEKKMRGLAYRRFQKKRVINKAMRSRVAKYIDVRFWANNMAKCSCYLCCGYKTEPSINLLKSDVSMRQQLGETKC